MVIISSIIILILLLSFSALVSGSEVAYFSLSPSDLDNLKKDDTTQSKRILKLLDKPKKLLATILISNNLINIGIVILSSFIVNQIIGNDSLSNLGETIINWIPILENYSALSIGSFINFFITTVGVTFLLVLFGEVAPKIYANINNLKFSKMMARPMTVLSSFFNPLSLFLVTWGNKIESRFISKRTGIDDTSKEELDKAIMLTVDKDNEEADILRGIIKFGNVSAKQIMKSRVDVVAVEVNDDYEDVVKIIKESGFSRIPVYKEDFDELIGILYVKDLLKYFNEKKDFKWQQFIRDNILYVPESKKIDDLLKEFQVKRLHMGIVVDEFGGSAGIVTLDDIMEEVVGEIKDEFDEEEEVDYIRINGSNFIFEGKTLLNDVARIIGVEKGTFDAYKQDSDSLAGLVLVQTGIIPKKDKEISIGPFKLKIVSVSKRRIEKIHLTIL